MSTSQVKTKNEILPIRQKLHCDAQVVVLPVKKVIYVTDKKSLRQNHDAPCPFPVNTRFVV